MRAVRCLGHSSSAGCRLPPLEISDEILTYTHAGLYHKLHGAHRPVEMKKSFIKRRKRVLSSHPSQDFRAYQTTYQHEHHSNLTTPLPYTVADHGRAATELRDSHDSAQMMSTAHHIDPHLHGNGRAPPNDSHATFPPPVDFTTYRATPLTGSRPPLAFPADTDEPPTKRRRTSSPQHEPPRPPTPSSAPAAHTPMQPQPQPQPSLPLPPPPPPQPLNRLAVANLLTSPLPVDAALAAEVRRRRRRQLEMRKQQLEAELAELSNEEDEEEQELLQPGRSERLLDGGGAGLRGVTAG